MSYTPTTWVDGETQVNAEHLNNLESGVKQNADALDEIATARANGEFKGEKGDKGDKGDDYVLTAADKSEMVSSVLSKLPTWTGGSY